MCVCVCVRERERGACERDMAEKRREELGLDMFRDRNKERKIERGRGVEER